VSTTEPLVNLARTSKLCDVPTRVFKPHAIQGPIVDQHRG
jgi:hypothetical protein